MKYDLSILIPARSEMFLKNTVDDILKNKEGKTEIIVGLDGEWSDPPVKDHPDVTIVYYPESIGQRAMTNQCAKLSKAKYLMKVDAHCAFDKGFDVKMMVDMRDNWTMIPLMKNLHVFDWVCSDGHRRYQGPSGVCTQIVPVGAKKGQSTSMCGKETKRDILWRAKPSPNSTAYRFDSALKFQYWGDYKKRQKGDICDTLSTQGSCFMITRDKYFELDICSEDFSSWGQQGVEVACKTWLSGGELKVNKKTWYAHLFRTQGGDFSFPYQQSGNAIDKNRKYSRELFQGDKWPLAKHKFQWLLDKFAPVPDWHDDKKGKGIIYYTDNQLKLRIAHACQDQLKSMGVPIVSSSLKPMTFGKNIRLPLKRGWLTMFKQILAALEASEADIIFFAEHDVMYHPSHFEFTPPKKDVFYYNNNVWFLRSQDGYCLHYEANQLSGLCAYKEPLITHFRERVALVEKEGFSRKIGFEPMTHGRIKWKNMYKFDTWQSKYPNVDVRHEGNSTGQRWKKEQFRNQKFTKGWTESTVDKIPGWENLKDTLRLT